MLRHPGSAFSYTPSYLCHTLCGVWYADQGSQRDAGTFHGQDYHGSVCASVHELSTKPDHHPPVPGFKREKPSKSQSDRPGSTGKWGRYRRLVLEGKILRYFFIYDKSIWI